MPSFTLRHGSFDGGPRLAALWAGLVAGPFAWAALLETNYVLSYVACEQRHTWMLHTATAVALFLVGVAAFAAWRASPSLEFAPEDQPSTDPAETTVILARFMAIGGLVLCAWFAIVILATELPVLVLHPCAR
jgi:hypothetical protein